MRIPARLVRTAAVAAGGLALAAARRLRRRDLAGERVLMTGGSRGLGFLLAREFGRRGCRIAICARDAGELAEARATLAAEGIDAVTVPCDVANEDAVARMMIDLGQAMGGVDVLVNNAGAIAVGPLETLDVTDFDEAMATMFWGVLHPTLAVLPEMRARGRGQIVNVTSIGGRVSLPHMLPYSSAKFAAVGLSEGLHAELAGAGIAVLTVTPGLMRTGSHLRAEFKGRQEREYAWFALGATLPGISMDAERAARAIVDAAARGASHLVLTPPARVAAALHGLFPGPTASVLAFVRRRLMPDADGGSTHKASGDTVDARLDSTPLRLLTTLGRTAAERFQHGLPSRRP